MNFVDYAVIAVIVTVIGGAAFCIYRAKRKGRRCIGCPESGQCGQRGCSCRNQE